MIRDRLEKILTEYKVEDNLTTNQSIDSILLLVEKYIERKRETYTSGKKYCDCPCPGPFCNDLIHPCSKPSEHYPQFDKAIVDIQNKVIDDLLEGLKGKGK